MHFLEQMLGELADLRGTGGDPVRIVEEETGRVLGTVDAAARPRRSREILVFLLLAVLIWPFIAVGVVAGWGFVVWMYYVLTGPPGPL